MEPAALLLVLASAFLHAAWNAALKHEPDKPGSALAIQLWMGGVGLLAGLADPERGFGSLAAVAWGLLAGLLEAAYFLTLVPALHRTSLAAVYSIARGGGLVVLWLLSVRFLGERLTLPAAAGVLLVLAGLALVSGPRSLDRSGAWWALGCALTIGISGFAYKQTIEQGARQTSIFALSLVLSSSLGLLVAGRSGRVRLGGVLRERAGRTAFLAVACSASFLLLLLALERGAAGAVMTLRNGSVLFALGLAWWLGERPTRAQLLGGGLVALGGFLVAAPASRPDSLE